MTVASILRIIQVHIKGIIYWLKGRNYKSVTSDLNFCLIFILKGCDVYYVMGVFSSFPADKLKDLDDSYIAKYHARDTIGFKKDRGLC